MIKFEYVKWKNFLSTGDEFTTIRLDSSSTTLICGDNGAGKSTLLDAITYVLYKKPFRNINLPQLVNSVNSKEMLVEIGFVIGSKRYRIRRGMKPAVFEIYVDGDLIPQAAKTFDYQDHLEKNILKMTFKTFCQIVVLGSANFTPFMLLPALARREIIEDLLDIEVFSKMFRLVKSEVGVAESAIADLEQKKKLIASRVSLMENHIKEMQTDKDSLIKENLTKIEEHMEEIKNIEKEIDVLEEKKKGLVGDEPRNNNSFDIRSQIVSLQSKEKELTKKKEKLLGRINELHDTTTCPTCNQSILEEQRSILLLSKVELVNKMENAIEKASGKIRSLEEEYGKTKQIEKQIEEIDDEAQQLQRKIGEIAVAMRVLENQNKKLEKSKAEINTDDLEKHRKALATLKTKIDDAINNRALLDVAAQLLKDDGIKTMIIRQYIPVMNQLINKYLEEMDFPCAFQIDESFKEKITSSFRDDFSYTSFSQGERMRIDIALLFTWREIAKMRHASLTNILILDEIMDSSLDATGTQDFIEIVKKVAAGFNIFIISHKKDQMLEKFGRMITFEKKGNFSEMVTE